MSNEDYLKSKGRAAALDRHITPLPALHDCDGIELALIEAISKNRELMEEIRQLKSEIVTLIDRICFLETNVE